MKVINIFDIDFNMVDLSWANKDSNTAFIYIADMDKYTNYVSRFWGYLSTKEKAQASSYHTNLLIKRYIISHGILRCILSYYTKQLPQYLKFTHNKYGKPFLEKSNIQFNLSHSHNMICCIVAFNYMVGIDIEFQDHTLDLTDLLHLVFTKKEIALFDTFKPQYKHKIFYNIWTKKESLVKAIGLGLSYPINTIEALLLIPDNKVILANCDNIPKQELYNYTLNLRSNYSGAISISNKVNEIVYLEVGNQEGIFDKVSIKYFK